MVVLGGGGGGVRVVSDDELELPAGRRFGGEHNAIIFSYSLFGKSSS